jgi:hypothetical protein
MNRRQTDGAEQRSSGYGLPAMANLNYFDLNEQSAVHHATRYLEIGDPQRALTLLREVRLNPPEPIRHAPDDHREIQRLRTYIEQAIDEIETEYPGHALRTLRVAIGREPLG